MQEVGHCIAGIHRSQSDVSTDTMIFMHHRITGFQLLQAGEEISPDGCSTPAAFSGQALAEQLLSGEDQDFLIGEGHTLFKKTNGGTDWCGLGHGIEQFRHITQSGAIWDLCGDFTQALAHALLLARSMPDKKYAPAFCNLLGKIFTHGM